jgi:hypothetical protein
MFPKLPTGEISKPVVPAPAFDTKRPRSLATPLEIIVVFPASFVVPEEVSEFSTEPAVVDAYRFLEKTDPITFNVPVTDDEAATNPPKN